MRKDLALQVVKSEDAHIFPSLLVFTLKKKKNLKKTWSGKKPFSLITDIPNLNG